MTTPFLPGNKQFAWDSTSLGWFKTCPRLYYYQMIRALRPKGNSPHLDFGIWYHKALEIYDEQRADGAGHEISMDVSVDYCLCSSWLRQGDAGFDPQTPDESAHGHPWRPDHNLKTRYNLIRSVIWYIEHFRNDPAKTHILATGKPAVELSFKLPVDDGVVLCGHLDRVVDFGGDLYVMDRKTSSSAMGGYFFDQFNPDNQMSLYTFAAQVILQSPIKGVIIDGAQIAVGFTAFARGFTFRTEDQLSEWYDNTMFTIKTAWRYAEVDFWPMNDKACNNYGKCAFHKVCSSAPRMREVVLASDYTTKEWNPLISR